MYRGNFCVNNGTRLMTPLTDNNLNRLVKRLKNVASGEIFQFNSGRIYIYDDADREVKWFDAVWSKGNCRWYERTDI